MTIIVESGVTVGTGITIAGVNAIVNSGLTLYLNSQSYSGSGSTWTADTGSNATLYNTPTYTAANPTYFSFDNASFEYASAAAQPSATNWTVEAWFRVTGSLTGQITSVVTDEFDLSSNLNFSIGTNNAPGNYNIAVGFFNGARRNTTGFSPTLNTWIYCAGTYDGSTIVQYKDGSSISTLSYSGVSASGGISTRIGRRWDSPANSSVNFFPGDVAIVRVYNRALTAGEISQNFNTERSRFGI